MQYGSDMLNGLLRADLKPDAGSSRRLSGTEPVINQERMYVRAKVDDSVNLSGTAIIIKYIITVSGSRKPEAVFCYRKNVFITKCLQKINSFWHSFSIL